MSIASVITIAKNHLPGLKATHESVLSQDLSDWEMIIVVGSSTDDTLLLAKALASEDSRIQIIEQESSGIYGAMNEGILAAKAEFVWFMNAGDKFATPTVMNHAIKEIKQKGVGVIVGGYDLDTTNSENTYTFPNTKITPRRFAFNRRGGCHQAMIFRRNVLLDLGGFDLAYSLASDFDLVLKVLMAAGGARVSEVYATVEPGGRADKGIFTVHQEKHQIRRTLLGGGDIYVASIVWTALARMKITLRRIIKNNKFLPI